jgi:hypothetical protein
MDGCCNNHTDDATCCSSADVMLESPHECVCGHDKAVTTGAEARS